MSALLETHESLPSSLAPPPAPKHRRVLAEHHAALVVSTLRTTFALDIPSDAAPAFQVHTGPMDAPGGLEWKVRLCLLVAIASPTAVVGNEGVSMKHMLRDGARGEWGSAWKACAGLAPLQRLDSTTKPVAQSWGAYLTGAFLGGDTDDDDAEEEEDGLWDGETERDYGGGRSGWREVRVETVECEVPIRVWPGNTAFKTMEVVFDV